VIDVLERRSDIDAGKIGIVGQSLGAIYAPLAAAFEPRIKACVANCGPFNFGPVLPLLPAVSQDLFRIRANLKTMDEALAFAHRLSLENGVAARIKCPLLVLFGAGDRIVPPSEGEKLAKAAGGPVDFVVYDEGNHVCFNIPYKFRPLTADWMAERLG
jgi:dienelactone hydrolase